MIYIPLSMLNVYTVFVKNAMFLMHKEYPSTIYGVADQDIINRIHATQQLNKLPNTYCCHSRKLNAVDCSIMHYLNKAYITNPWKRGMLNLDLSYWEYYRSLLH